MVGAGRLPQGAPSDADTDVRGLVGGGGGGGAGGGGARRGHESAEGLMTRLEGDGRRALLAAARGRLHLNGHPLGRVGRLLGRLGELVVVVVIVVVTMLVVERL